MSVDSPGFGIVPPEWMRDSACLEHPGLDWFAPADFPACVAVCAGCGVRAECEAFARSHGIEHGVWGGLTGGQLSGRAERQRAKRAATSRDCGECGRTVQRLHAGRCWGCYVGTAAAVG